MSGTLLIVDDSEQEEGSINGLIKGEYKVVDAGDNMTASRKAEMQKFDGICTFFNAGSEDKFEKLVEDLRLSSANKNTPILVIAEAFEDAAQCFHDCENIIIVDSSCGQENVLSKIKCAISDKNTQTKKLKLDANFINILINSTKATLIDVAGDETVQQGAPFAFKAEQPLDVAINAISEIHSESFDGFFSLYFSNDCFLKIAEVTMEEKYEEIVPDTLDVVRELNNIIYGQVKRELSQMNYQLSQAIPEYEIGDKVLLASLKTGPSIVVPFESQYGSFGVCISLGKLIKDVK